MNPNEKPTVDNSPSYGECIQMLKEASHTIRKLERDLVPYRPGSYAGSYKIDKTLEQMGIVPVKI